MGVTLGEEEKGNKAELLGASARRGVAGGRSGGRRCTARHSAAAGEGEQRIREARERMRRSRGKCGIVQGVEAATGSRRWPDAWPVRDEHAPSVLLALG